MSIEEQIASAIGEVVWNASNCPRNAQAHIWWADIGPFREKIVAAVLPLVRRAQAAARVAELRDIADEFVDKAFMGWPHNVDVREAAEHFEGMALKRADRIENEGQVGA